MQDTFDNINTNLMDKKMSLPNDLHSQVNQYFMEAYNLVFQVLPDLIKQAIDDKIWLDRQFPNFGAYVLDASSSGLNICNNNKLKLLKHTMDIYGQHAGEWSDVLTVVDGSARQFAKKNKIQVRSLHRSLDNEDINPEVNYKDAITYLPSRAKSNDAQLLKLRNTDQEAYHKVTHGQISLKDAFPKSSRKYIEPIESVKNKFNSLSSSDRDAFIAWIEQQKEQG